MVPWREVLDTALKNVLGYLSAVSRYFISVLQSRRREGLRFNENLQISTPKLQLDGSDLQFLSANLQLGEEVLSVIGDSLVTSGG